MQLFNRDNTMTIEADTEKALNALRGNLKLHMERFREAKQAYYVRVEEKLKEALEENREAKEEGTLENLHVHLPAPQHHKKVYITAIRMLEAHEGETITLTSDQVNAFLHDQWNWTQTFAGTYVAYTNNDYGDDNDIFNNADSDGDF